MTISRGVAKTGISTSKANSHSAAPHEGERVRQPGVELEHVAALAEREMLGGSLRELVRRCGQALRRKVIPAGGRFQSVPDKLRNKPADQFVLHAHELLRTARIALTRGTDVQLPVDAMRLMPLGGQHAQHKRSKAQEWVAFISGEIMGREAGAGKRV